MSLDKKTIVEAAARIADIDGISKVNLTVIAKELGIKSPSLYKHFSGGIEELNKELMLYGWHLLECEITKAAIGKAKDDAIIAICNTYRSFVLQHKGLFEAMQWYNMYQSKEHLEATKGLTEEEKVHSVRVLRGFLQGFCSIESHNGYGNPIPLDDTFEFALKTILNGIRDLQK